MRYLILTLWLCTFLTTGVQSQNFKDITVTKTFLQQEILLPSDIAIVDDWLFVRAQRAKYGIKVFDPETGKKLYEFGRSGRGPGEYLSFTIQRGPGPDLLEVSDTGNKKNDIYDVSCLKQMPPVSQSHKCITQTRTIAASRHALILKDDLIINHGSTTEGVLFLSKESRKESYIDQTPLEIEEKFKRPIHHAMSMTGRLTANGDRTRFAYFADSFDRALFFKRIDQKVQFIREHKFSFLPEFEVKDFGSSSILIPADNYRAAFASPVTGKNNYFVLYSGKSKEELKNNSERVAFANTIKIFNLNGDLVKEINIDKKLFLFTVNQEESMIYGIHYDENSVGSIVKASIE